MHRSDSVNLTIGAILIGIGAVILGLIAPTAAAVVAGVSAAGGLYVIVGGVYFGLPTPATALERAFRPALADARARVKAVVHTALTIEVSVRNRGRDDLVDALVKVFVPDYVTEMNRCSAHGEIGFPEHKGSFWDEGERFWNGNVTFPGRDTRLIFFAISPPIASGLTVRLRISSPVLDEPFEEVLRVGPMPQSEALAHSQVSEPGGRGS